MKLYLIHTGFYDKEVGDGVYECHTNFFVVAPNAFEAKMKAKQNPSYQKKKMHVDGIHEIHTVDGYNIRLEQSDNTTTAIRSIGYQDIKNLKPQEI